MPQKKIIREPVEKLSSDNIVEITEDSSSEEEDVPMVKPVKKERTPAQNAATQKMLATRRRNKLAKLAKVADPSLDDVNAHPVKAVAFQDELDKPMTGRQLKAFVEQMHVPKPAPVKKPRKPRATKAEVAARKAERVVIEPAAPPPPTPFTRSKPEMLFV